jgi:O-antigen/teichoic acid export membrane protein
MSHDSNTAGIPIRRLIGETAVYGLGGVFDKAVGFMLLPITTAFLTPGDYGLLGLVSSTTYVLYLIFSIGMPAALMRFYLQTTEEAGRRAALATALFVTLAGASIGLAPLVLFADPIGREIFGRDGRSFLLLAGLITVLMLVNDLAARRLQADGKAAVFLWTRIVSSVTIRGVGLLLIILGWGAWGWLLGELIGQCATLLIVAGLGLRGAWAACEAGLARAMAAYGLGLLPGMLSHWVMTGSDKYLLRILVRDDPFSQIGFYTVAERVSSVMQLVNVAFLLGWRRFAFHNMHLADGPTLLARGFSLYIVTGGYLALALSLLGDDLTHWLIPSDFEQGVRVIPALTAAGLFTGLSEVVDVGMHRARRTATLSLFNALAATANVILNFWLIPPFGITGAAGATLLCQILKTVLVWHASHRAFPIPIETRRIVTTIGVFLIVFGVGSKLGWMAIDGLSEPFGWIVATVVQSLLVVVAPVILALSGGISQTERRQLSAIIADRFTARRVDER